MRKPNDDVKEFLTRVSPYIESEGARNLLKISDELSIPYQTVRFRLNRLRDQGIGIYPYVVPEKIGLTRIRVLLKFEEGFDNHTSFFGGLHQSAGLIYYARSMISHIFDSEFLIPNGREEELSKLLQSFKDLGVLKDAEIRGLRWKEILMMKTEMYDYEHESWDVDYSSLKGDPSIRLPCVDARDGEPEFDHTDLLIIKNLQTNSWIKNVELGNKLGITDSDVAYHLSKHVFGRRIIQGFRMKWTGPKEAWSRHSIVGMTLFFKNLTDEATRYVMSILTALPFTWNHMKSEDGTYISELLIPVVQFAETMGFLSNGLSRVEPKPETFFVDYSCSVNYTIPYQLHADETGWRMNSEESLGYILEMIRTFK